MATIGTLTMITYTVGALILLGAPLLVLWLFFGYTDHAANHPDDDIPENLIIMQSGVVVEGKN